MTLAVQHCCPSCPALLSLMALCDEELVLSLAFLDSEVDHDDAQQMLDGVNFVVRLLLSAVKQNTIVTDAVAELGHLAVPGHLAPCSAQQLECLKSPLPTVMLVGSFPAFDFGTVKSAVEAVAEMHGMLRSTFITSCATPKLLTRASAGPMCVEFTHVDCENAAVKLKVDLLKQNMCVVA